jgi:uncharacterized heparinase superfamily protein
MNGRVETRWRRSLDRWGAVLRYHRPQQLARRFWNRVRERLPFGEASVEGPTPDVRSALSRDAQRSDRAAASVPRHVEANEHAAAARNGKVRLLNREFALGWPPRWDDADRAGLPLLAAFHLHYHEHLVNVVAAEPDAVWQALASWIERFPAPDRTAASWAAWHPYCVSRRVFAWLKLLEFPPPAAVRTTMIEHLPKQARRLASRFERDIGGNHLWENARALAALGAFFEGDEADGWRRQGLETLWRCVREQLSPEGEHFERSPMYQAELAHGLHELTSVLEGVDDEAAARCRATSLRMSEFLDGLRHPDGGLPLFGDTTRDADSPNPNFILHPSSFIPSQHGDYFVHRSDRGCLLFDAGDVGPDDLPAHAHSDLLGFEASAFGKRLFVDSGVFCYQGRRREEFRGAAAHNVLTVDDVELADVWGSFRLGRRGHVVDRQSGRQDGVHWIKAEHDAYRRMGVRVQRWWLIAANGAVWVSVHVVLGRGNRLLTERLHLHPQVVWTRIGKAVTLQTGDGVARWASASPTELRTETTAYSERFYEERPKTTLVLERQTGLPAVSAWAVALGGGDLEADARIEDGRLLVRWTLDGVERRFERGIDE